MAKGSTLICTLLTLLMFSGCAQTPESAPSARALIVATGNSLVAGVQERGGAVLWQTILGGSEWSLVQWPNWLEREHSIIFEGKKAGDVAPVLYKMVLARGWNAGLPAEIAKGHLPSLSPNEDALAFFDGEERLFVRRDNQLEEVRGAAAGDGFLPAVWLDTDRLTYVASSGELQLVNIPEGLVRAVGVKELHPVSFHAGWLICLKTDGSGVFRLNVEDGSIQAIRSYRGVRLGMGAFWDHTSGVLLVSRQSWAKILRLNEGRDLYALSWSGAETLVRRDLAIFGGFAIPANVPAKTPDSVPR